MKPFILLTGLFASACLYSQAQSYELTGSSGKDTVNLIDQYNCRQGKWEIRGMHHPAKGFKPEQLIESGIYLNNRKVGEWAYYYNNANIKNKIMFVNGSMNGHYTAYYRDGSVFIDGERTANRWKGKLTVHDKFGNTLIIHHDENGKELSKEFIKQSK